VEELATRLIGVLAGVPALWIYLIAAAYVGVECIGIGVPVEPVMLFVGSLATQGHISLALAILATGVGCVALGAVSYLLGRDYGTQAIARFGRFVGLTPRRAAHLELWLRRHSILGVLGLRLTPMVRSFASFVSGVADVPGAQFALGTFVGSAVYSGVWLALGDALGANYRAPLHYLDEIGPWGIVAIVVVAAGIYALHFVAGHLALRGLAAHFRRHLKAHPLPLKMAKLLGA
jgi:membrane protein DedA with SNARE-associated domain